VATIWQHIFDFCMISSDCGKPKKPDIWAFSESLSNIEMALFSTTNQKVVGSNPSWYTSASHPMGGFFVLMYQDGNVPNAVSELRSD